MRYHFRESAEPMQFSENPRQRIRLVGVGNLDPRIQATKAACKFVEVDFQTCRVDDVQRCPKLAGQRSHIAAIDLEFTGVIEPRAPLAWRNSSRLSKSVTQRLVAAMVSPQ